MLYIGYLAPTVEPTARPTLSAKEKLGKIGGELHVLKEKLGEMTHQHEKAAAADHPSFRFPTT
jgi:hypothetical protein